MAYWGYGKCCGPETWSQDYPFAGGKHQSPINIHTENVEYDSYLEKEQIRIICEKSNEQVLIFHGHNFKVEAPSESMHVSGGPLSHTGTFKFVQFHLHWGRTESDPGSEHYINGHRYPAEIHMVHFNATKYVDFEHASNQPDGLLVLAIFVKIGNKNLELEKLIHPLTDIRCFLTAPLHGSHANVHLEGLLPHNIDRYYTYSGSLTTPPCYESVTWIVFEHPITMTADQLMQISWTHLGDKCGSTENCRPVCPLNGRIVRKSFK